MAAVEFLKRRCVIAVQLVPSQRRGYAPEHLLVGAALCREVDQLVAAARGISVREEQRNAKLLGEPVVEAPVPTLDRCPDFSGVRQKHIAVSAAGIKKVRPPDAAEGKQLVCVMLHRKFKKEQRRDERRDVKEKRREEERERKERERMRKDAERVRRNDERIRREDERRRQEERRRDNR